MSDMTEKVTKMMDSMTDEDWEDFFKKRDKEEARRNREIYGENWKGILENIRERREAPIEENQDRNRKFISREKDLLQKKRELQRQLETLRGEKTLYAEDKTGLRLHERVSLEYDGGGIISGFETKENGQILVNVRFQFGSGTYHPEEITDTHGIAENAEKYM